jgi:hypothetical protein
MFIDWLTISQEHDHDLPVVCDTFSVTFDALTDEVISVNQPRFKHESSHSTKIDIHVRGRSVRVDGNPSRVGRLDNLFGYSTIEQCVAVYNGILAQYGLPPFTRCTRIEHRQDVDGSKVSTVADGAIIQRLDLTTNVAVGSGNEQAYLRGVSSQRIGHSIGFLYPNGMTVVWTPSGGEKGGRLQYRKAYSKSFEMQDKLLPRIKRLYGEASKEFEYVHKLHGYCLEQGIVRMEQELKSEYLKREGMAYWGLFEEHRLNLMHDEFLSVDKRLKVDAMDMMTIADKLIEEGIVKSRQAANATASVAYLWMQGSAPSIKKTQFETHAARLNRIGINIRNACDTSRFAPVFVRECREVTVSKVVSMPAWYVRPNHLQLVA